MKKLFASLFCGLSVVVGVFATGSTQVDSAQSGVLTFSGATTLLQTNQFAPAFDVVPIVKFFGSLSNAYPITYVATTTNFIVTTAGGGSTTNYSVAWNAFQGTTRMFFGSQFVVATAPTNVSFPYAYAFTNPSVSIQVTATNDAYGAAVTATSATNFTVQVAANQWIYWQSIGIAPLPVQGAAPAVGLTPVGN